MTGLKKVVFIAAPMRPWSASWPTTTSTTSPTRTWPPESHSSSEIGCYRPLSGITTMLIFRLVNTCNTLTEVSKPTLACLAIKATLSDYSKNIKIKLQSWKEVYCQLRKTFYKHVIPCSYNVTRLNPPTDYHAW